MEVEKERLFQELQKELAEKEKSLANEVEAQKGENEELEKYVRKLEKEHLQSHKAQVKDFTELSRKQQKRRLDTLTTRAQKALWFIDLFGLQFDSLQLCDQKGMKFLLDSSSEQKKKRPNFPHACKSPPTLSPTPPTTPPPNRSAASSLSEIEMDRPRTTSPPTETVASSPASNGQGGNKATQFDSVTEADKSKIETVLFLMDKFAVGDAFIHELSMVIDGMPRSYLIKQCRDKLNSTCYVKPIPGGQAGAQVSFKESLKSKLSQVVTNSPYFDNF